MSSYPARNLPPPPRSTAETGLSVDFIADLALKTIYVHGMSSGQEIASALKLPFANVTSSSLDLLRRQHLIEVSGGTGVGEALFRFVLSTIGRKRAQELMEQNQYEGPAPVTLAAYTAMVQAQAHTGEIVTRDTLKQSLSHLVLSDTIIDQLGPALNSGRSLFLYGSTGNGKTSIALAIGSMLPGAIWIPHAVTVDGQMIKVYDELHHRAIAAATNENDAPPGRMGLLRHLNSETTVHPIAPVATPMGERYDQRWVRIHRPLIVSGGELTLKDLALVFDPTTQYYQAPQQMKANGGVFLVDDLGRQRVSPRDILNRWIVPLEKHVDYLTLATGYKFDIPFDVLILFATNLKPEEMVDEAILRRLRHKIQVANPTWDEFREIFTREAAKHNIPFADASFQTIVTDYYTKRQRVPRGVHPRDILDELVEIAHFQNIPPSMSQELVQLACQSYFLE